MREIPLSTDDVSDGSMSVAYSKLELMNEYNRPESCGPSAAELADWLGALRCTSPAGDDAERIDRIRRMEQVKSALAAAQAREAVAFIQSQLECQKAAGVRNDDLGRGVSAQVALARRQSPHRGGRLVGLANALVGEMPQTLAAMEAGELSEWRATLVVRETACLRAEDRVAVDARLAGRLALLSDRQIVSETRRHAYALDPYGFVNRFQRAEADRRVTLRPAPDTMSSLSALLPAAQGVAILAELSRNADARRAAGDPRTRGQLMADTLVERVTGLTKASGSPVDVQLVMTDRALFLGEETPARLNGYGAVPAACARSMVRDLDESAAAWVRRLYSDPATGRLVQMDSTRRTLDGNLRRRACPDHHPYGPHVHVPAAATPQPHSAEPPRRRLIALDLSRTQSGPPILATMCPAPRRADMFLDLEDDPRENGPRLGDGLVRHMANVERSCVRRPPQRPRRSAEIACHRPVGG